MISIRPALLSDAAGVNGLYNPVIRDSIATFEIDQISDDDRRVWLETHAVSERHPVVVAETDEGAICGFASASQFDPRRAYETSVKTSVFVGQAFQGQGVAHRLYDVLFNGLSAVDIHRAYALIVSPNPASVALHKAFGFTHVSTLNEVGRKFGRYCDVMWFEKRL